MEIQIQQEDTEISSALQSATTSLQKLKEKVENILERTTSHTPINISKDPEIPYCPYGSLYDGSPPRTRINIDQSHTISRFPVRHIRETRAIDIRPRVVSIGPFFHGDSSLEDMERKKPEYMRQLFSKCIRDPDPQPLLFSKIKECEIIARECYSETTNLGNDAFVGMLLLDSCFILMFLFFIYKEKHPHLNSTALNWSFEDVMIRGTITSLFSSDWTIRDIRSDLLLLENQIPLFVLMEVHNFFKSIWTEYFPDISTLLKPLIDEDNGLSVLIKCPLKGADHLLGYYWRYYSGVLSSDESVFKGSAPDGSIGIFNAPKNIPSATELHRTAGVVFKKRDEHYSLVEGFKIQFHNGVMEMPSLDLDTSRKTILTNLVGYEKSLHHYERTVSSYMLLMDSLINTEKDVELLQEHGVIVNKLSSNSSAATFFNEIGDICTVDYHKHLYAKLFRDVKQYYGSKWNRRFASLLRDYFNSPWAGVAVFAASLLLILTIIQTISGVIQTYYTIHPHN